MNQDEISAAEDRVLALARAGHIAGALEAAIRRLGEIGDASEYQGLTPGIGILRDMATATMSGGAYDRHGKYSANDLEAMTIRRLGEIDQLARTVAEHARTVALLVQPPGGTEDDQTT